MNVIFLDFDGTLCTYHQHKITDIEKRIKTHNEGIGAKYTRARLPVKLVYYETHENKSDAMKREAAIKKLTREEKLKLIQNMRE